MRPRVIPSVLFVLFISGLSGCNLPRNASITVTPDAVATQVATLLSGMPTADLVSTVTPELPTTTAVADTPTLPPVATSTLPADDPRATLGEPTYRDVFAKAALWGLDDLYDDGHTRAEVKNNSLILTSLKAEGWMGWRTTFPKPGDAYIEGFFSTGQCSGSDQYGLVFRSTEDSQAGFYGVTCDGRYGLTYYDGSQFTRVLNWQESTAILTGANQTNRLGVWVEGSKVRLYANGSLLTETTLDSLAAQGNFGAFISAISTVNFTVSLSEIAYWEIQ